ncbi:hypothetical protein GCM10007147_06930 [Nocardiopsis kunsanensis]|uniref:Phytanoyl-CoA dioxygenase family protein n=1 Tax=Nocardiopsis kunsanensis TaxID=141693 RepID=A0A918X910_9ACTN|nr:phytanoyl-CoA dioxygenase family protein [Nocardiopsis kunsanensis]GHD17600.1 hypothetical protein GCM10007147_06930 [Nocardiopsis kunsanensis]
MAETRETTTPESLPIERIASYRSQGFAHVPGVLNEEEIELFRSEASSLLDSRETMIWDMGEGDIALDWVADANAKSDVMRRLTMHPSVSGIASRLAGGPLSLFKSELLRKSAGSRTTGTPAHDDQGILPYTGQPASLTAWVALVDVPVERGCMSYIPGSHLRGEPHDPYDEVATLYPLDYWPELTYQQRLQVPVRAGDVVYHHERTVHVAGVNQSDTDRMALASIYMSADAVFRENPFYAGLYTDDPDMGGMKAGQRLDDDRFPRVGAHL